MAEPYVGEIRRFPNQQIPDDWLECNGQTLDIDRYAALFAAIGATYGGDGKTTFAVPDLSGRVAIAQGGPAGSLGQSGWGAGPSQPYLALVYAIASVGVMAEGAA